MISEPSKIDPGTRYYHGGPAHLHAGDWILPPCVTGAPTTHDYGAEHVCRTDRVYLTTDRNAAAMFAAMCPSKSGSMGRIYEVIPFGDLVDDPDCNQPGLSVEAEKAQIIRAYDLPKHLMRRVRMEVMA